MTLRGQMTAAPLKEVAKPVRLAVLLGSPRSNDRGPIEGCFGANDDLLPCLLSAVK